MPQPATTEDDAIPEPLEAAANAAPAEPAPRNTLGRIKTTLFGRARDLHDQRIFHTISLIPLLAYNRVVRKSNRYATITGADGRVSTSRVNVAVWTVAIAFGISTLAAFAYGAHAYSMVNPCAERPTKQVPTPPGLQITGICVDGTAVAARDG